MTDYQGFYATARALLIGIDNYQSPDFSPLGRAEQDAREMAEVLGAPPYNFNTTLLLGADATKQAILDLLYEIQTESGPDDCMLVYFSGHGYTIPTQFGQETGYLACADTIPERHHTALRMDELTGTRDYNPAKHIAFILDACFSGNALGLARSKSVPAEHFMLRRAYQVMSAGAPDQAVSDYHSMTTYMLPLLREPSGMLTLGRLATELRDTVTAESRGMQIPLHGHITGSQGGEFVFYVPPAAQPIDLLPEAVSKGLLSDNADVRYYAIGDAARLLGDPEYADNVRVVLEDIVTQDADPNVRSRAFEALRQPVSSEDVAPPPETPEVEPPPAKAPPVASTRREPSAPAPESASPLKRVPIWGWGIGAVVLVVIAIVLITSLGAGGAGSGAETPESEPSSSETALNLVYALAEAGVSSNDDWSPHIEEIDGVEMALVPAGCFQMGSEDGSSDEQPVHEVCFEEPFWIDVYEVTNAQYGSEGRFKEADQPREQVSWDEALAHCEDRGARLPTEAEWEYAARGPDGLIFPWGNSFEEDSVVNQANTDYGTVPVGSFPKGASWVSAHDMIGNVSEWVSDWYGPYSEGRQVSPSGPESGTYRVLRGDSWTYLNIDSLRAAARGKSIPSAVNDSLGFRCAQSYNGESTAEAVAVPTPSAGGEESDLLAAIRERGVLLIATDPAYPPQSELVDGASKPADSSCTGSSQVDPAQLTGFDVDVGVEIANQLGVVPCFVTPDWTLITSGGWADRWDISIGSMTVTPERMAKLYFTQAYYTTPAAFFVHEDNTTLISPADLTADHTVGLCGGCTYEVYMEGSLSIPGTEIAFVGTDASVTTYDTDSSALQDLAIGDGIRLDAVLTAEPTGHVFIEDGFPLKQLGEPVFYEYLAGAVDRDHSADPQSLVEEVTRIINEMHADGTLLALSEQYYGLDLTSGAATFDWESLGQFD